MALAATPPKELGILSPKEWLHALRSRISTLRPGWRYMDFGCIHRYDLFAPPRNARSQPQVWPVSREQLGELGLWDDSIVHRFASVVVACASIAGHRGQSCPRDCADWLTPAY